MATEKNYDVIVVGGGHTRAERVNGDRLSQLPAHGTAELPTLTQLALARRS